MKRGRLIALLLVGAVVVAPVTSRADSATVCAGGLVITHTCRTTPAIETYELGAALTALTLVCAAVPEEDTGPGLIQVRTCQLMTAKGSFSFDLIMIAVDNLTVLHVRDGGQTSDCSTEVLAEAPRVSLDYQASAHDRPVIGPLAQC